MTQISDEMVATISKMLPAVDGQIVRAAVEINDAQKKQPEWSWINYDAGTAAYGRWPGGEGQAPYIRADLVVDAMRRALSAALADAGDHVPDTGEMVGTRWRHKGRGTTYTEVGRAEVQVAKIDTKIDDGAEVVAYRGEDGRLWVRAVTEFEDGRFERLPDAAAAPAAEAVTGRDADTVMVRVAVAFDEGGEPHVHQSHGADLDDVAWDALAERCEAWRRSCIATIPAPRPVVAEVGASVEGVG